MSQIQKMCDNCFHAMNDDFNTALTIGHIFTLLKKVNVIHSGQLSIEDVGKGTFIRMKETIINFTEEVLGLKQESNIESENLLNLLLHEYKLAKDVKNYEKVDDIRSKLKAEGIIVKDMKSNVDWAFEE